MKRDVRRIHWYRAEKEKTNYTEVIKDQTYNNLSDLSTIQFRLIFKGHKSLNTGVYSNTFDIRNYNFLR
jgi:hypothetical protein